MDIPVALFSKTIEVRNHTVEIWRQLGVYGGVFQQRFHQSYARTIGLYEVKNFRSGVRISATQQLLQDCFHSLLDVRPDDNYPAKRGTELQVFDGVHKHALRNRRTSERVVHGRISPI